MGRTQRLGPCEDVCIVLHVSPRGYAKELYSVGFSTFDVGVGLQLLVMPDYGPAFTSTPTRRGIRHTYAATFFASMDCLVAEFIIGAAEAWTRWLLAMTSDRNDI